MKIKFVPANKFPEKSGKYLWESAVLKEVQIITVVKKQGYMGTEWWGIVEFGGKNVKNYSSEQFSEEIEFIVD